MSAAEQPSVNPSTVLCKALFKTQDELGLNQQVLGQILGMDRTTVKRLQSRGELEPQSKTGELAACLIRIFRALYVQTGGDQETMRHWMATPNRHLHGVPQELVQSATGLVHVVDYLDAIRGKV